MPASAVAWQECVAGPIREFDKPVVLDMQKTVDYLSTKGVGIVWGPRVRETYSRAEICDPNGYRIELRQWFR